MPYKDINKRKEICKKWYQKNRDKIIANHRIKGIMPKFKYTLDEKILANRRNSRKHYRSHILQERKRTQLWRLNNKDKQRFIEKRRRIRKINAIGIHTYQEWMDLKLQYGNMCVFCQKQEPEIKLIQDHIIPLNKGGSDFIENIQPLCMSCNTSKQDKIMERDETYFFRFSLEEKQLYLSLF